MWLIKEDLVLAQLEADNFIAIRSHRQAQHIGAAGAGGEYYTHHFEHALAELKGIGELLFPWIDSEDEESYPREIKMWEDTFGIKMGSPEWDKLVEKYEKIADLYSTKREANERRG